MVDEAKEGPSSNWLSDALNPAENLRMLADAQRFGDARRRSSPIVRAAALGPTSEDRSGEGPSPASESDLMEVLRRAQREAMRASEIWFDLMSDGISLLDGGIDGGARRARDGSDAVALTVEPGGAASGVFWVHNSTPATISAVRPHCGALRSHDGHELTADMVSFEPAVLDPLPARSSCGIEVRLHVPASTPPGRYVSAILVANLPAVSLPLLATVVLPEADAPEGAPS